jgi:gluconate 2-dehydrogenase subunit 3-like protein
MNSETFRAVIDCLIPADDFPGAYDAGVCDYIQRLLQTDLADQAEFFHLGIDAIDAEAHARFEKAFTSLGSSEQIAMLAAIESGVVETSWPVPPVRFFKMLVNTTVEGYYSEPQQGGNRGGISWVMTGFEELSDS